MSKRIQVVLSDEIEKKFRDKLSKDGFKKGEISEEIEALIKHNLSRIKADVTLYTQPGSEKIGAETLEQIKTFYKETELLEKYLDIGLIILNDKKTKAFYTECHIKAEELVKKGDKDAVVDPENQEEFKLNRNIQEKHSAFLDMVEDAENGRQFSDIIIDFNLSYRKNIPLKILGGQHRFVAVERAIKEKKMNQYHGIRVYFNLDVQQRVEIAVIANTNINISLDLRDRLREHELKPEGRLRAWCWEIGILEKDKDFADKRKIGQEVPTVRMMRTFIVNFYQGKRFKGNIQEEPVEPYLCETGGIDEKYLEEFSRINKENRSFNDEKDLVEAGKMFVKLHLKQKNNASKGDKYKALSLSVISSWSFTAGALQKQKPALNKLYSLPDFSDKDDPLNANAMNSAKHPKLDPSTYRGLGVRTTKKERGRLLQLFYNYAFSEKEKITPEMYEIAIRKYHFNLDKKNLEKESGAF